MKNKSPSVFHKQLLYKKQHIKNLMSDLYREISPNSKILKSLLQNNLLPLNKDKNSLPNRPIMRKKSLLGLKSHASSSIIIENEDFFNIKKNFTIEGPEIDELYIKNTEDLRKNQLELKKMDEVLYETLQRKQLNPPSFAESLKQEMTKFIGKSLDFTNIEQIPKEKEEEMKLKNRKSEKNLKNAQNSLERSIRKRLEQKKSMSFSIKGKKTENEFLNIYRGIQKKQEKPGNQEKEEAFNENLDFSLQKSETFSMKNPFYEKRLKILEQRKVFERLLQNAKGKLVEKLQDFNEKNKKKAKTMYESMTVIDKIKRKYEFFGQKTKKPEEEVLV